MKAYLIDYFWTSGYVYLFDSACKTILVNYNSTCSLQFFIIVVLFSRIMFFKSHFLFVCESVRLLLASTSSELRFYIKCVRDSQVRVLFTNTRYKEYPKYWEIL